MKAQELMINDRQLDTALHLLMDSIPAGFFRCTVDREQRVDMVNRETLNIFGCSTEEEFRELTGGSLKGMLDAGDYEQVLKDVRKQFGQDREILGILCRIQTRDGQTRWVDCRSKVLRDKDGNDWAHIVIRDDTESQNQKQAYREKSVRDSLTGLLNKEASEECIAAYLAGGDREGSLLIIDLDNFKLINDTKGHLFGDSVLTETARCIEGVFDTQDIVGRIGGDEFIVLAKGITGREKIMDRSRELMDKLACVTAVSKGGITVGCSIGAAVFPGDGTEYKPLFLKADMALYAGKNWGKGRCVLYDPSLRPDDAGQGQNGRLAGGTRIDSDDGRYFISNETIYYVFRALYESTDTREAINTILKIVGIQFNVSRVYIFEDRPDGLAMDNTFEWCNEGIEPQIHNLQNMSFEWSAFEYKENFGQDGVFLCMDVNSLPKIQREVLKPQGIRSLLQCGIYDSGRLVGFVGFDECRENRRWTGEQIEVLTYVAQVAGTFLIKDRAQQILKQKLLTLESVLEGMSGEVEYREDGGGKYDALTNLLTAGAFQELAEQYLAGSSAPGRTAVLILDMDDFRELNKAKGQLFGNVVLMNVANCLKRSCREDDLIARFGGDEFLVLLKNTDRENVGRIGEAIRRDIAGILSDAGPGRVCCSIGAVMMDPEDRDFSDSLVKADHALHSVKRSGKNGFRFYEPSVRQDDSGTDTYDDLRQTREEKRREQSSLNDKTTTAVALEVFEKTGSFEDAVHILMGFLGNHFRLNRIVLYKNGKGGFEKQAAYQWVDDRTALLYDPTDSFRREEFYICYHLYDGDGIAVLDRKDYSGYNTGLKQIMDKAGACTMLFAGIFIEGRYSGMMVFVNTERGREWTGSERTAISEMARIIASGIKNTSRLMEVQLEAEYYRNKDALTGLMRYDKFKEECQELMDAGKEDYVIVASDIKGFKFINEVIGYTQGDNILRMFGDMLIQNGTQENRYTRISADLFLAFGPLRESRSDYVKRVQDMSSEFCRMENEMYSNVNLMIRSGVYFIEKNCREIETAVDRATIARKSVDYIIKSTCVVFNDGPFDSSYRENEIINRMEYALRHREFKVFLQPQFRLSDLSLVGAEALVRWQWEDGRLISPGEFVPLFEKNGFIAKVDTYVFEEVCRKQLERLGQGREPLKIALNLSSVDISEENLISRILECTRLSGLDHRHLEFELTETAFLNDSARTYNVMKALRDEGFTTSIDDFGAGYSIMNMMADIPADVIKLDCGFVQSCGKTDRGREFLRQLIQMTNKMGYTSLCEGIETKEQLEMLTDMGCELGQGYYFSRPLPMDAFFEKFC